MEEHGIDDLTRFATDMIRRSGEAALKYYAKGKPQVKFDEELVTEAELYLTEFFQNQLYGCYPEHLFFNDSQRNKGYTHDETRCLWIYDPIDGIANFQAGIPIWGTSLALLENFWPIFGLFYMPATGDLFHAQAGHKSYRGEHEIGLSPQSDINDESVLLTYSRFNQHYRTSFPGKIRNLGCTGAHICYVAMGRAEAAIIDNESYQGLAAARVIIETAGGKIYKMDGREFFLNEYLEGQKIEDRLLVTAPSIYSQVRPCIQEIS
ncbi:MAG: inositol monophosphatase family protein [Pseudomonadota bacterium]